MLPTVWFNAQAALVSVAGLAVCAGGEKVPPPALGETDSAGGFRLPRDHPTDVPRLIWPNLLIAMEMVLF